MLLSVSSSVCAAIPLVAQFLPMACAPWCASPSPNQEARLYTILMDAPSRHDGHHASPFSMIIVGLSYLYRARRPLSSSASIGVQDPCDALICCIRGDSAPPPS